MSVSSLLRLIIIFLFTAAAARYTAAADYYVDPANGSDSNTGNSIGKAFKSIEAAKDAIALVNDDMDEDITVYLRGGIYNLSASVVFDQSDSGKNGHKVIYKNYGDEEPVLSGGKTLTVKWTLYKENIFKAQIGTGHDFRQLYIGGKKAVRARQPNAGQYFVFKNDLQSDGFDVEPGMLDGIADFEGVEIAAKCKWMHKRLHIKGAYQAGEYQRAVIDEVQWKSLLEEPQGNRKYITEEYWLENAYSFLDSPGEWYFDKAAGILYYWPGKAENADAMEIVIPQLNTLVAMKGSLNDKIRNITFEGIAFKYTNWARPNLYGFIDVQANTLVPVPQNKKTDPQYRHNQQKDRIDAALQIYSGDGIKIKDCTFENLGGTGVTFNYGGSDNVIEANTFSNIAASAIEIGSDCYRPNNPAMWPRRYVVFNNRIANIGTEYFGSIGICVFYCDSVIIQNNFVYDVPYTGISVGWGWHNNDTAVQAKDALIKNNRVERYLTEVLDGAGIYSPNPVFGSTIEGNYIKDMMTERHDPAIYNDGCGAYWLIRNNVVENANRLFGQQSFKTQEKRDIIAEGNYSTTDESAVYGVNRIVRGNSVHKDGQWPDEAADIIKNAGITELSCPMLAAKESDTAIVVDNSDSGFSSSGNWQSSRQSQGYYGIDYCDNGGGSIFEPQWAKWTPSISRPGDYNVYIRYPCRYDCCEYAPVEIAYNGGKSSFKQFTYDQRSECCSNQWIYLGRYNMTAGDDNYVKLYAAGSGITVADAVKFVKVQDNADESMNLSEAIKPAPQTAKFTDEGYYVWCGSVIEGKDGKYHLFYSRWPLDTGFQSWATHSEIAHAVADDPLGTFRFADVALPARGGSFWDGDAAHNPTIKCFDGRYYLYYTGNRGDKKIVRALDDMNWVHRNNQRIGVAVADSPEGPWTRFDKPLIDVSGDKDASDSLCVANPSVTQTPDGRYLMIYKGVGRKRPLPFGGPVVHRVAIADMPDGRFEKYNKDIFTSVESDFAAEDPFVWYDQNDGMYYAIVKDKYGFFTGSGLSLALFSSGNGLDWRSASNPLVTTPKIRWENHTQRLIRLERPQLLFKDNRPVVLVMAAMDSEQNTFNVRIPLDCGRIELPPVMTTGEPAPGKRVRQTPPEYAGTDIHHSIYLPADWQSGKKYPVMVEYTGNYYPPTGSTGKVENANLGYGLCGPEGWIWVVLPFVDKDGGKNAVTWWGDKQATIDYCTINIPRICRDFGGDENKVFLCGFSRGAIAVNYIGLADDKIAPLWRGMITHDHYDGIMENWPYPNADRASALERLKRLNGRPQLICANKSSFSEKTLQYLSPYSKSGDFTFIDVPMSELFDIPNKYFIAAHTDLWMCKDSPYRQQARQWLKEQITMNNKQGEKQQ